MKIDFDTEEDWVWKSLLNPQLMRQINNLIYLLYHLKPHK